RALLALGFLLALRELVLVLAEIEELDHRRRGHRCELDAVQGSFLRQLARPGRGHHPKLGTLFIDDPHLRDTDHLVDAQVSTDGLSPSFSAFERPARDDDPGTAEAGG